MYWLKILSVMIAGVWRNTDLKASVACWGFASLSACSPFSAYSRIKYCRASGSSSELR